MEQSKKAQNCRKLILPLRHKPTNPNTTSHIHFTPSTPHWLEQTDSPSAQKRTTAAWIPSLCLFLTPSHPPPQGRCFTGWGEEELLSHKKVKETLPGASGRHRNQMTWNTFKAESQLTSSDSCCWTNLSPWGADGVKHCKNLYVRVWWDDLHVCVKLTVWLWRTEIYLDWASMVKNIVCRNTQIIVFWFSHF